MVSGIIYFNCSAWVVETFSKCDLSTFWILGASILCDHCRSNIYLVSGNCALIMTIIPEEYALSWWFLQLPSKYFADPVATFCMRKCNEADFLHLCEQPCWYFMGSLLEHSCTDVASLSITFLTRNSFSNTRMWFECFLVTESDIVF